MTPFVAIGQLPHDLFVRVAARVPSGIIALTSTIVTPLVQGWLTPFVTIGQLPHDLFVKYGARVASGIVALTSSVATVLVRGWWDNNQAKHRLRDSDLLDRFHVSLNILQNGELKIRTIVESALDDVIHNAPARKAVVDEARAKTNSQRRWWNPRKKNEGPGSLLLLKANEKDRKYVLQCVLNSTAQYFNIGPMRLDASEPVNAATYVYALSCEPVDEGRYRKIRALLIRRDALEPFAYPDAQKGEPKTLPRLESNTHEDRVIALRDMAVALKENPKAVGQMEIIL